jgi:4-amino-4-deoxy-L-arabinose transferase-like glycosyltransferase
MNPRSLIPRRINRTVAPPPHSRAAHAPQATCGAVDGACPRPQTLAIMSATLPAVLAERRRTLRLFVCAMLAAILYLPALGRPALWEPDEGRYAEIAREMLLAHDYVTPRDNWVRYFEKPPLVYWAEALSIKLLALNELAVRLPAALASVAEVTVTAALGEAMCGAAVGLTAAMVLALSPLVFGFARFATLDPPLALFITAALGAFWAAARAPGFDSASGRRWFLLSAAMAAAGTLTKGPVALLLTGAVGLAWLIGERRAREILRMPWIGAIAIYVAISAPWFVLAARRNRGFLRFFFIHEHVERYLGSAEHGWGPYFFVMVVIAGMWPWICFVPMGIRELMRARGEGANAQAPTRRPDARSQLTFMLWWFGIILVFFSIPRAKLGSYILPALPPLAIIAGYALWRLPRLELSGLRKLLGTLALLNLAATAAVAIARTYFTSQAESRLLDDTIAATVVLTAASLVCLAVAWRGRNLTTAVGALALGVVMALGVMVKARLDAEPLSSYRELARAIVPFLGPGCRLASYRHFVQSLPFYTGYREALVGYRGELASFGLSPDARESFIATDADLAQLWHSPGCAILVVNRNDFPHVRALLGPDTTVVGCEGKKLALYNRVVPGPAGARPCRPDFQP